MYADELLLPWLQRVVADLDDVAIFDCHNHVGSRDPTGFNATVADLQQSVALIGGRSVVTPLADPAGYAEANRACARAARDDDALVAFTRLTPGEDPAGMLDEGLSAGSRGIKLHGTSDRFAIDDPRLEPVYQRADDEELPVLVHAGPEEHEIGTPALRIAERYPGLRLILAHCALPDLGWLWREVPDRPNLFFDTSWWSHAHLMALFRLVPPGRILLASDLPYASPLSGALATLRCAWQAGLSTEQVHAVAGGQLQRLVDRSPPVDLGPPPSAERRPPGPLLEILSTTLTVSLEALHRGEDPGDALTLARHGCRVAEGDPDAALFASVSGLLDLYDEHHRTLPRRNQHLPGSDLVAAAALVARTPAAGP